MSGTNIIYIVILVPGEGEALGQLPRNTMDIPCIGNSTGFNENHFYLFSPRMFGLANEVSVPGAGLAE